MTVSNDVQREIVSALLKNSYLFSICKDELNDGYFTDGASKIIYKALSVYYNKYNALPGLNELIIGIDECYVPMLGIDIADVKDICCKLYERPEADESFIKDKLTDFIRKVRSADALKVFIDKIKNNSNLESDTILSDLVNALDVQLSTSKLFQMNDLNALKEARLNAIGSDDQSTVIPSYITSLNNALAFGGYQPGTVSMVVAPPGTGKSMHLINEGVNAAKRGFEVLHILIGDLVEYDGFVRYLSCISSVDQNQLIRLTPEKQMELVKYYDQQYNGIFGRIQVLAYPSLSLTVDTLIEEINKFEKHSEKDFGMIIIDYPDNLLQDGKSLYEDGGTLYSSLERLARLTKSVLLVASQPGKMYWNHSIIPLEAAAESSKKQQAVDNMLTLNTEFRGAEFGSMLLAKARKGEVGKIFRFKTDFARCKIEEIDEGTYNTYKASSTQPKSSGYNKQ